jgi:hypothetical protein
MDVLLHEQDLLDKLGELRKAFDVYQKAISAILDKHADSGYDVMPEDDQLRRQELFRLAEAGHKLSLMRDLLLNGPGLDTDDGIEQRIEGDQVDEEEEDSRVITLKERYDLVGRQIEQARSKLFPQE